MMPDPRDFSRIEESTKSRRPYLLPIVSISIILLIQTCHIGIVNFIWAPGKPPIDRAHCQCGCWDTVFKGTYQDPPAGYKHFYFNATLNTLKIWILTVFTLIAFYETLKHLLDLYQRRKLRWSTTFLFVSVIYAHYYAWWGFCNYLNDEFYPQWYHQLFFTLTELASTVLVLSLCSTESRLDSVKLMAVISIAITHIFVSGVDQFVYNVLFLGGRGFQIARDLFLMFPDILHVIIPLKLLFDIHRETGMSWSDVIPRRALVCCVVGVVGGTFFAKIVFAESY